jgi:hypothetical protein
VITAANGIVDFNADAVITLLSCSLRIYQSDFYDPSKKLFK